jgi:carbon-monoxide dehydrogenase medium subunit
MYAFNYHRPASVADAASLASQNADGKLLAGGMTLLPTMKQRLAGPSDIIDLSKLDDLRGIEVKDGAVTIKAMTRHVTVATSPEVQKAIPALADLAGMIGDPAVRNKGTIGGSVANNDPAADYPAACLALRATITTNKRAIKADAFFKGLFETALEDGEIITSISFPVPEKANYQKFRNPASRYALVGVFVAKTGNEVRVAVTGAGNAGVFRAKDFETALASNFSPAALDGKSVPASQLNSDMHADADYRSHLITVIAKRAVAAVG